jgi:hypothetical protein
MTQCEYLYDDETLAGAISLDLLGEYLQCKEEATWEGTLPPDDPEEEDVYGNKPGDPEFDPFIRVSLCDKHKVEAEAEGLFDIAEVRS